MTGLLDGELSPRVESISAVQQLRTTASAAASVSIRSASKWTMEGLSEECHAQFHSLQEWICELLIKNQQLRMALVEIKARELRDRDGHDIPVD